MSEAKRQFVLTRTEDGDTDVWLFDSEAGAVLFAMNNTLRYALDLLDGRYENLDGKKSQAMIDAYRARDWGSYRDLWDEAVMGDVVYSIFELNPADPSPSPISDGELRALEEQYGPEAEEDDDE